MFYKRKYGLDYRAIRLPNVIGPGAETHGFLDQYNIAEMVDSFLKEEPACA